MDRYVHYDRLIRLIEGVDLFFLVKICISIYRSTVAVLLNLQAKLEEVQITYEQHLIPGTQNCIDSIPLVQWLNKDELAIFKVFKCRQRKRYQEFLSESNLDISPRGQGNFDINFQYKDVMKDGKVLSRQSCIPQKYLVFEELN